MFGIDQISWGRFSGFILCILILWYLSVILWAWIRMKNRNQKLLFENDFSVPAVAESGGPVLVSSKDYPSELIPLRLSDDLALPVSLYEETGLDEGYLIDCFSNPDNPQLSKILEQVQFQQ